MELSFLQVDSWIRPVAVKFSGMSQDGRVFQVYKVKKHVFEAFFKFTKCTLNFLKPVYKPGVLKKKYFSACRHRIAGGSN